MVVMMNSDSDDDPVVKYGTAMKLPDNTSNQDKLKFVPVHEQVVTDEEGRRRFHGAFTGGFSAGYYNTVGTKEGWTPSSFISSRSKKSERKVFQPEDFMDNEDKSDLGMTAVKLRKEFLPEQKRTSLQEKQLQIRENHMTLALGSDVLDSLVVPKRSNIGFRLLRLLGWREGRKHGTRGKREAKKVEAPVKVYGCQLPGQEVKTYQGSESSDEEMSFAENLSFASIEVVPERFIQKDNYHGIGYNPLNPTAALHTKVKQSTSVKGRTKTGSRLSFMGQAFGVGAFEEEDEDIYSMDSMQNYDSVLGDEVDPDSTYGWTKPKAITGGPQMEAIESGQVKLTGFVPAKQHIQFNVGVRPPPAVPPDFDPHRRRKLQEEAERIKKMNLSSTTQPIHPAIKPVPSKYEDLTFEERRSLLSEEAAAEERSQKEVKSVFDLISKEDKERLEAAKRKQPITNLNEPRHQHDSATSVDQPSMKIDPSGPLCDPKSLKPFSGNPEKQRRYEQYERAVRQRKRNPYSEVGSSLTEWERNKEREEFARTTQVYSRLSHSISSRFAKAESSEAANLDIVEKQPPPKIKVFGVMTRDKVEWHPDPLLCKRFNVPNPYPGSDFVGTPQQSTVIPHAPPPAISMATNDGGKVRESQKPVGTGIVSETVRPPTFGHLKGQKRGRWDQEPVFAGPSTKEESTEHNDNQEESAPEEQKENAEEESVEEPPTMELFKSIFADDDEDSSDVEESDEKDEKEEEKNDNFAQTAPPYQRPMTSSDPVSNGTSPPAYKGAPPTEDPAQRDEDVIPHASPEATVNQTSAADEDDYFGPALPPPKPFYRRIDLPETPPLHSDHHKLHKKHSKHKKHKKDDKKHKKKKKHK